MEILSIVLVGIIVAVAFGYALWPLFRGPEAAAVEVSPEGRKETASREIARLFAEREQAYKNIMEIDLDREMGKLSDEDYEDMIGQARADALEVLRRLEARGVTEGMVPAHVNVNELEEVAAQASGVRAAREESSLDSSDSSIDDQLEEEILRYRKVKVSSVESDGEREDLPPQRFCHSCGAGVEAGHKFCSACGEKLN